MEVKFGGRFQGKNLEEDFKEGMGKESTAVWDLKKRLRGGEFKNSYDNIPLENRFAYNKFFSKFLGINSCLNQIKGLIEENKDRLDKEKRGSLQKPCFNDNKINLLI